jgi:hypothetical protein
MGELLKNTFQWSVSRERTFRECPRQYWFNHYGFWPGWEFDADARTRDIYVLKQLKSRQTWVGEVVHDCIKHSVENLSRGIRVLPVDEILKITRSRMRNDFRVSRDGFYRENPKAACGLFEHEYRVPVRDEEWRECAEHVDRCLVISLDGATVTVKLDCATRETDHVIVWDWKTGKREGADAKLQLACYAFYIHQAYGIPIHRVRMRRFELSSGNVREQWMDEKQLTDTLEHVRGSIADMQSLLEDVDRNLAKEERFRKEERREVCLRCNFLRVCAPNIGAVGPGPRA